MRTFLLAAVCAAAASPAFAGVVYEVSLVNATQSGIVAIEVALAGSDRFHRVTFVKMQRDGGGESATVQIRAGDGGCRRDLRISLADGSVVTRGGVDICDRLRKDASESL